MWQIWQVNRQKPACLMTLIGGFDALKRDVAVALAHKLSRRLLLLSAHFIPKDPNELRDFAAQCQREILLHNELLLIDCSDITGRTAAGNAAY